MLYFMNKKETNRNTPTQIVIYVGVSFLFLLLLSSCSFDHSSDNEHIDPYIYSLLDSLAQSNVAQTTITLPDDIIQPNAVELINNGNNIIVSDFAKNQLFYLKSDGEILSVAGGSGRGPGEYELLTRMTLGNDHRIYVHDGILRRITVYEIADSEFRLLDTQSYETPDILTLYEVYITKDGTFGLYNESGGFEKPENRNLLYRLDENYSPVEQILAFPGDERYGMDVGGFWMYAPHDYTNEYQWIQDEHLFFYVNNYDALIRMYDLKTDENTVLIETNLPERPNNEYFLTAADSAYDFDSDKDYWEVLENHEFLPVISGVWADSSNIVLGIVAAPGDEAVMLLLDRVKSEWSYFKLPPGSGFATLYENAFYSIKMDEEGKHYLIKTTFLR